MKKLGFLGMILCGFGFVSFLSGCDTDAPHTFDKQIVVTYAELSMMYEKEKMVNKITDSLYQGKVNEFFRQKGTTEEEFKKQIEELTKDNKEWRDFIQQVSTAMDSLKSIGVAK